MGQRESLRIGRPPRRLEAVWDAPPGHRDGVVLCHPHPQFGGSMDDAVVVAVADALVAGGRATLRFNFGGVGRSEGGWGGGAAELLDVATAADAVAERLGPDGVLSLVGYSFGAWAATQSASGLPRVARVVAVAPPLSFFEWSALDALAPRTAIVVGTRDQYCPADRLAAVRAASVDRIEGADHFLAGCETAVARRVVAALDRPDLARPA